MMQKFLEWCKKSLEFFSCDTFSGSIWRMLSYLLSVFSSKICSSFSIFLYRYSDQPCWPSLNVFFECSVWTCWTQYPRCGYLWMPFPTTLPSRTTCWQFLTWPWVKIINIIIKKDHLWKCSLKKEKRKWNICQYETPLLEYGCILHTALWKLLGIIYLFVERIITSFKFSNYMNTLKMSMEPGQWWWRGWYIFKKI